MNMIVARNKAVHTYDEKTVMDVISNVTSVYYRLFVDYEKIMLDLSNDA